ncbi:MAG: 6-bladed beta-propeller [Balneolaceae bacterium]|nr:6-bladed beta-propeller [Balneolaceae bacterium]
MSVVRYNIFLLLVATLLLSACGERPQEQDAVDPGTPMTLHENLVISSGDEGGSAPFLTFVNDLAVDRQGAIYVYVGTDGINEIYKFDREGTYIQTLGGEGRGPGEHQNITAMYVDSNNRLITADFDNARLTMFDQTGDVLRSEPAPGINRIVQIRELPDGRFVLIGWNEESQSMAHVVSRNFSRLEESVGEAERVIPWFEDEMEKRFLTNQAGKAVVTGERAFVFIPSTYAGKLHLYTDEGEGYQWARAVEGYQTIDPPLQFGSSDDPPPRIDAMLMMRGGRSAIIMQHSVTFGMYPLRDGTYLHISYRFPEGEGDAGSSEGENSGTDGGREQKGAQLVIEHFSDSLELLRYTVTDTLDLGITQRKRPLWVDRSGQLYLADNSDDSGSVVRRFQIVGLGLD